MTLFRRRRDVGPLDYALYQCRAIVVYLGAVGSHYQDVILWGRPEDARVLLELGYQADFQRGGLLLARFHGCPLSLTFPPEALPPRGTRVELGWLPAWHVTRGQCGL